MRGILASTALLALLLSAPAMAPGVVPGPFRFEGTASGCIFAQVHGNPALTLTSFDGEVNDTPVTSPTLTVTFDNTRRWEFYCLLTGTTWVTAGGGDGHFITYA